MNNSKITFIDTSNECIQMMKKLSKDALKQSGKIITSKLQEKIPSKRGFFKKSIKAWAKIKFKTGQPYLEIGYLSRVQMRKKYGIKYFVNATWFEFGTQPHAIQTKQLKNGDKTTYELHDSNTKYGYQVQHPGMQHRNYLRNTVYENIEEINSTLKENLASLDDYVISQGMSIDLGGDEEID